MTQIQFETPAGDERVVTAADGESIMRVAVQNDVPGIVGECGGELSCGTCHVYVGATWDDRLPPITDDEVDMLEMVSDRRPTSRLACQLFVGDDLDGIRVTIAREN